MPFWKRSKVDSAQAEKLDAMAQLSEMPARLEGTGVCSVAGCGRATGIACQYVDRRNRSCKSAWCPVHRIVVNGQILCRRRILVVDDDPRLRHIVDLFLSLEGFDVAQAESGEDCLNQIAVAIPDLVILDIMMPGMDGIEACKRIRSNPKTARIPVLMFSALSGDVDVENARLAGANHLITKPFNLVGLGAVVRSFLPEDTAGEIPSQ